MDGILQPHPHGLRSKKIILVFRVSNSELHRLLLDCNETEQAIITRMAKELKATLVSLGI